MPNKLILHIPHASKIIPDKNGYVVSDEVLNDEILLLTDWHTEDLFDFAGGISITANFNRVFCDVERFANDDDEPMAKKGMGAIYTKLDGGGVLRNVSDEVRNYILEKYYCPHHQRLSKAVAEQLSNTDSALIIDCHSFSNKPFKRDLNHEEPRPDFCIGIDDYHTPRRLYKLATIGLKMLGYKVVINAPYSGSIVPMEFYRKDKRVLSMMIEINRNLYLVPGTNQKNSNYCKIKSDIHKLLSFLSNNGHIIKVQTQL